MNQNKVQVKPINVYGKSMVKPIGPIGELLKKLLGKDNLNQKDIDNLKALGFEFEVVPNVTL